MERINLRYSGEYQSKITNQYQLGNGYRGFNCVLKQFNTQDSMSPFSVGGNHGYSYCGNNPINHTDPTGHFFWELFTFIFIRGAKNAFKVGAVSEIEKGIEGTYRTFETIKSVESITEDVKAASRAKSLEKLCNIPHIIDNITGNLTESELINMQEAFGEILHESNHVDIDLLHDIDHYKKHIYTPVDELLRKQRFNKHINNQYASLMQMYKKHGVKLLRVRTRFPDDVIVNNFFRIIRT